ncbi:MAG: hypothetical protein ACFB0B_19530 [Thermonemataceae bacterium]
MYTEGFTRSKIKDNAYIRHLFSKKKLKKHKSGNTNILEAQPNFKSFYEKNFKENYEIYIKLFRDYLIDSDSRSNYLEEDLLTLLFIANNKHNLKQQLSTVRTFSATVFDGKGSKYLENNLSLKKAVCKILSIDDFPENDPKNLLWRFVIDCTNPILIVLCENLAFLKIPKKAKEKNVELWYVGGNNVKIVDDIDKSKLCLPIYYSCDWDYHGLSIYSSIKEKMKKKGATIKLLLPPSNSQMLPVDSPNHNSQWNSSKSLSGLKPSDFTSKEIELINKLIQKNQWIEEESNDLMEVLSFNNV